MKMFARNGIEYFDTDKAKAAIEKNEGTYPKRINSHRRVYKWSERFVIDTHSYGIELEAAEWLMQNAKFIEFRETDSKVRYIVSVENFKRHAIKDQLGVYDTQLFIRADRCDQKVEPKPKRIRKPKQVKLPPPPPTWKQRSLV